MPKPRSLTPIEILPPEHYANLSYATRRLYGMVWNKLNRSGNPAVRLWNRNLAVRATIAREDVAVAQDELCGAGLLTIQCVASKPDDWMIKYRVIQP